MENPERSEPKKLPHLYKTATNILENKIRNRPCIAIVHPSQLHSKFLRLNRESREETLCFSWVHGLCHLRLSLAFEIRFIDPRTPSVLYFNPEYDFIHITRIYEPLLNILLAFVHDLKAYDPRGLGLFNLALSYSALSLKCCAMVRDTFVSFLKRKQQLI
ncbi:hypothetical protein BJ878DRAFT_127355 [Calycina marina]|uniref:Uncharacterized protein n=1 Tax=Calycina marina TaxID=1763456 RepID=A0A9P8CE44_9HELO|nr:hypothetical protein BJ878DRAFT_127355 [Calycina marina]